MAWRKLIMAGVSAKMAYKHQQWRMASNEYRKRGINMAQRKRRK